MDKKQRKQVGFSVGYFLLALLGVWLIQVFFIQPFLINQTEVPYSQFRQDLANGEIDTVNFGGDRIIYTCCVETPTASGTVTETVTAEAGEAPESEADEQGGGLFGWFGTPSEAAEPVPQVRNVVAVEDPELVDELLAAGVTFSAEAPANNFLGNLLIWILPFLPLLLIWYFLFRRMRGGGGANVLSIGKSKAREISGEMTGITFADVGGADEALVELREVIDFLKSPDRFTAMGAKLPKGVLMVGPPGTGKTLLAKATAGEAGVPFFLLTGSDFVEMFVGVGAARVRDLFEQAKAKAPCIVFIDEIDAIGQSRSTVGAIQTNDEREQTLNALLAEMDGFEPNNGVVIMAATNRPEVLDKALLRPGRFDRQIEVTLPSEPGRLQILNIHTKHVKLDADVRLDRTNLSVNRLLQTTIIIIAGGVYLTMANMEDPLWWQISFSHLGTLESNTSWLFNSTLTFAGVLFMVWLPYLMSDIKILVRHDLSSPQGAQILRFGFIMIGTGMIVLGLVQYGVNPLSSVIHNAAAYAVATVLILLMSAIRWLVSGLPREVFATSWLLVGAVLASLIAAAFGYFNTVGLELITFTLGMTWLQFLVRNIQMQATELEPEAFPA